MPNVSKQISLKAARVNAGYTQTTMARLLNVNPSTYNGWERGKRMMPADKFVSFGIIVGLDLKSIYLPTT